MDDNDQRVQLEIAQQQRAAVQRAVDAYHVAQGILTAATEHNEREARERWQARRAREDAAKLCYLVRESEGAGYDPERQLNAPARSRVLWEERGEL
jgi:hypothetical protein